MICRLCQREAVGQRRSRPFSCPDHDRACAACRPMRASVAQTPTEPRGPLSGPTHAPATACFACGGYAAGACRVCGRPCCSGHGQDATCAGCYDRSRVRHGATGLFGGVLFAGAGVGLILGPAVHVPIVGTFAPLVGIGSVAFGLVCLGAGLWMAMRPFP